MAYRYCRRPSPVKMVRLTGISTAPASWGVIVIYMLDARAECYAGTHQDRSLSISHSIKAVCRR